jgi:hypothetical protein
VRGERRREEVTTRLQWRTSGGMEPRGGEREREERRRRRGLE